MVRSVKFEQGCQKVTMFREATKKVLFLVAGATKKGEGGLNKCATKNKNNYFFNLRKKVPMATKPRGP